MYFLRPYDFILFYSRFGPILTGLCFFFTVMAFYCSAWVAPSDFQQGENSRILYIHVPVAWMSLLVYIAVCIASLLFLLSKHPMFSIFCKAGLKIGTLFTLLTLVTGSLWGRPMWGTFWVWDARLTSVLILLFIYYGALRFQEFSPDIASIFLCIGLINIPIIKFSVNWWNTLHQPSSISQFDTSIHISMLIPILLMFMSLCLLTCLLIACEGRQMILSSYSSSVKKTIRFLQYDD